MPPCPEGLSKLEEEIGVRAGPEEGEEYDAPEREIGGQAPLTFALSTALLDRVLDPRRIEGVSQRLHQEVLGDTFKARRIRGDQGHGHPLRRRRGF